MSVKIVHKDKFADGSVILTIVAKGFSMAHALEEVWNPKAYDTSPPDPQMEGISGGGPGVIGRGVPPELPTMEDWQSRITGETVLHPPFGRMRNLARLIVEGKAEVVLKP